jgi:multiple sugar transport system substrate-binding protein
MPGRGRPVVAACCALLAALAPGCEKPETSVPPRITFQTLAAPDSAEFQLLEALVARFNAEHPSARVVLRGDRPRMEYLLRGVIAQTAADVIEVRAGEVPALAERGAARPFTSAATLSLGRDGSPAAWALGHRGDELYAVPWAARPKLLLYNRAAFRRAGLPERPPRTWKEWAETASALTRDTDGDGSADVYGFALAAEASAELGRHFATLVAQQGVGLLEERETGWYFSTRREPGERAMALLLALQESAPPECVVTNDAEALEQFRSGEAAMVIAGPEALEAGSGPLQAAEIGVAPIPMPEGGPPLYDVEFRLLAVTAFVEDARYQTARSFVRFLAGASAQRSVARGTDAGAPFVPVRRDVLAGAVYAGRPRRRLFAGALGQAAPVYPSFVWEGKCAKDWIGELHALFIRIARGPRRDAYDIENQVEAAFRKGDRALSCLHSNVGHPSLTMTLGMSVVAVFVFIAVAYAVARH